MKGSTVAVAFYIHHFVTLGRVCQLMECLKDLDMEIDYNIIEFDDGMSFWSYCHIDMWDKIQEWIDTNGNGEIVIDWDLMSEIDSEDDDE